MAEIVVSREGPVQVLTIARPEKKNALTAAMYAALADALAAGGADEAIGATVLFGSEGVFTAGNDIADFAAFAVADDLADDAPVLRFLRLLSRLEKPLLAGVDGLAVGIGTTLLFHCDIVFATPDAKFIAPFVDLGLVPEAGVTLLGPQRLGHARAFELLALGRPFDADAMAASGIVNAIVPSDELRPRALETARALAAKPREALRLTKAMLREDRGLLAQRIEDEISAFKARLKSPEAQAAFAAFLARA